MWNNLHKRVCRTVGPLLAASLEALAYRWIVASLSLFYRSSQLAEVVPLPHYCTRSICYSNRLHGFFDLITRCYKGVYLTIPFHVQLDFGIICLWNAFVWPVILMALSLELLSLGSFQSALLDAFHLNLFFFNSMPRSGRLTLHGVNSKIKKRYRYTQQKLCISCKGFYRDMYFL